MLVFKRRRSVKFRKFIRGRGMQEFNNTKDVKQ